MAILDLVHTFTDPLDDGVHLDFGYGVWGSPGQVFVGSPTYFSSDNAIVYRYSSVPPFGYVDEYEVTETDWNDFAGENGAANGDFIFLGAVGDDTAGSTAGAVLIYDNNWNFVTLTYGSLTNGDDRFGSIIYPDKSDDTQFISGSGYIGTAGSTRAYAFDMDGNENFNMFYTGNVLSDYFGSAIACGFGLVVVGSPGDDDAGTDGGAVVLYDSVTGATITKITAPEFGTARSFGAKVEINSQYIFIAAAGAGGVGTEGYVYVYDHSGMYVDRLDPPDVNFVGFGNWLNCTEDHLAISVQLKSLGGTPDFSGAVCLYDMEFNHIGTVDRGVTPPSFVSDGFGDKVAMIDGYMFVGCRFPSDEELGAVFVYEISPEVAVDFWTGLGPNAVQGAS